MSVIMPVEFYDRQRETGPLWALPEPSCVDPEVGRGIGILINTSVLNILWWGGAWAVAALTSPAVTWAPW